MRKTAGTAFLRQVNDDLTWFVVCSRRAGTAFAPRAKRQTQFAIQGNSPGWNLKNTGHVHQRVIGFVQVFLPAAALNVITKLNATKTKRFIKHFRGNVNALTMICTNPWLIGLTSNIWNPFRLLK